MSAARYALYFAPAAESPFWRFGCAWLGRDPERGGAPARPSLGGDAAQDWDETAVEAVTRSPANYGFHATLKPPFRLSEGTTREQLLTAAAAFAKRQRPFRCADVGVAALGRFIAFRLLEPSFEMQALAARAVESLDAYRGPQTEEELAKRRAAGLTERQERMLKAWGYPYVMDEFRFHMTLTGAIADDGRRERLAVDLARLAEDAGARGPMLVDGLALYEQPEPGAPFRLFRRLPFGG